MEESNDKYKTILVIVTGLAVLGLSQKHHWFIYIAIGTGIISLLIPVAAGWVVKCWYKLAEGLGWVNSHILLCIVFYLFLYPVAVLSRLVKRDPLNLKKTDPGDSFYEIRNHKYTKDDLENVW